MLSLESVKKSLYNFKKLKYFSPKTTIFILIPNKENIFYKYAHLLSILYSFQFFYITCKSLKISVFIVLAPGTSLLRLDQLNQSNRPVNSKNIPVYTCSSKNNISWCILLFCCFLISFLFSFFYVIHFIMYFIKMCYFCIVKYLKNLVTGLERCYRNKVCYFCIMKCKYEN